MPTMSTKKKRAPEPANDESSDPPEQKKAKKICCIEGCTNKGDRKGGFCTKHYAKTCCVAGCTNLGVRKGGVCQKHVANGQLQAKEKKGSSRSAGSGDEKNKSAAPKKNGNINNASMKSSPPASNTASTIFNTTDHISPTMEEPATKNAFQQTSPTWEEMFYKLVLYQANNHGSTIIDHEDTQNKDLAKWVASQRMLYRTAFLQGSILSQEDAERKKALQQIGFFFEGRFTQRISQRNHQIWNQKYEELIEYGRTNGHLNPHKSEALGTWCERNRLAYREYKNLLKVFETKYPNHPLIHPEDIASIRHEDHNIKELGLAWFITKERIDKLDALGFIWEFRPPIIPFAQRLEEYKEFQQREGHGLVPQHYKENRQLGKWVARQRCEYKALREGKKSTLTPEKLAQLEAINFEFCYGDPRGIKSKEQFRESSEKLCEEEEEEDTDDL